MRWQFWIDVGGTFTDCVARSPEGTLLTWKTLSSGVVKGCVGLGSAGVHLVDPLRANDPVNFWAGWQVTVAGQEQRTADGPQFRVAVVAESRPDGTLILTEPLPAETRGRTYELRSVEQAPLVCIRRLLKLRLDQPIPAVDVRLGTTRGTNALLERKGARTAFLITRGFRDLLLIGDQDRPELFSLDIRKPSPLYATVVEVDERLAADGSVLESLNEQPLTSHLRRLREEGIDSLAICLLHAYRNPLHELRVEAIARDMGFQEISRSSAVAPVIKIVARAETTVLDAYLTPVLRSYVGEIRDCLGRRSTLKLMTSHGGLIDGEQFSGKDCLLSGPAGGVIASSGIAQRAGFSQSIGFDMGGTSTDVSRFGGRYELEQETFKAGVRVASPMLAIETVAAGGGSICTFDGVQLRVGPESAGAEPGPTCYGRGGPLTVTDLNVVLGRVLPDHFPFPLDRLAVTSRLETLCRDIAESSLKRRYTPEELAQGFLDIANETMARAIRRISVQKGYDPAQHVLVSFGGAGGQHACAVAEELGIRTILVHPFAGMLSAYGMGLADLRRRGEQAVLEEFSAETLASLEPRFAALESRLIAEIREEGIPPAAIVPPLRALSLRYRGVESTILVDSPSDGDYRREYEQLHEQFYGYRHEGRPVEIVTLHVEVIGHCADTDSPDGAGLSRAAATGMAANLVTGEVPRSEASAATTPTVRTWCRGRLLETSVFLREQLQQGRQLTGPAILCDRGSTVWIEPGFDATVGSQGEILITRLEDASSRPASATAEAASGAPIDPIRLELFNNRFASIAEQMGVTLRRTAVSTNVKERLDYSCAVFDASGGLVVNAPHIPVHLGAMSETVRCIIRDNPDLAAGDVFVTNDPYAGGSHLPDVTVVTPIHDSRSEQLLFFTASRAHHAEIGGITPGSMPPFSTSLADEGVLIRNFKLIAAGRSRMDALHDVLTGRAIGSSGTPSRNPDDNLADINAQVAANRRGAALLQELVEQTSAKTVLLYMQGIQQAAAFKMRRTLAGIANGRYEFRDWLDDGSPIQVALTVSGEEVTIDFAGTGPVLPTNLNANRAIVTAAVMYVLRCLIDEPIPLNSGVLEPVTLVLPECLLNPPTHADPRRCAAMVGGNVETSQRIVDVLLGALGRAAASQGTMNNLTFGNDSFGYYETICGGAGGTPRAAGADAVHTHMTNTRLTDVEIIEHRYPVRIEEFGIRRDSGGNGRHNGGDGVRRTFRFLEPLEVSLLTQRRGPYPPFGLAGGDPGALGRHQLQRAGSSKVEEMGGVLFIELGAGDRLTIETPGGGGFGAPTADAPR